jgi:hypothetical protein
MRASARALAICLVAVVGCSDDAESPSDDATSPGASGTTTSVGVGGGGASGAASSAGSVGSGGGAGSIAVAATSGTLELPFSLDAVGAGTSTIGAVEISGAVGSIVIDGASLAAVAYERQPFDVYVLYQLLAVDEDRLFVVWLYCQGAELVHLYWEGTDGTALDQEMASGSCDGVEAASTAQVALPAVAMEYPATLQGYSIDGPLVHLDGQGAGSLDLGAGPMVVLPFEDVDCSDCPGGPWSEVHTLLWDPAGARLCFAIFYLFSPGDPVVLTYSLTLPDLSDPAGQTELEATFSVPR